MSTNCLLSGRSREGQGPNCQGNQRTGDRKSLILTPPLLDRRLAPPARLAFLFHSHHILRRELSFPAAHNHFFHFFLRSRKCSILRQKNANLCLRKAENQIVQMRPTPDDGRDDCRDSHYNKGGGVISRYHLECLFQSSQHYIKFWLGWVEGVLSCGM